jgi:hypothetical protein
MSMTSLLCAAGLGGFGLLCVQLQIWVIQVDRVRYASDDKRFPAAFKLLKLELIPSQLSIQHDWDNSA